MVLAVDATPGAGPRPAPGRPAHANGFAYGDIVVPPGTRRLAVVLAWNEPPASSGASRAALYDVDLWIGRDVNGAGNGRALLDHRRDRHRVDGAYVTSDDASPSQIQRDI